MDWATMNVDSDDTLIVIVRCFLGAEKNNNFVKVPQLSVENMMGGGSVEQKVIRLEIDLH